MFIGGYPALLYAILKRITDYRHMKLLIPLAAIILSILSPFIDDVLTEYFYPAGVTPTLSIIPAIPGFVIEFTIISLGVITVVPYIIKFAKIKHIEVVIFIVSIMTVALLALIAFGETFSDGTGIFAPFSGDTIIIGIANILILYVYVVLLSFMIYVLAIGFTNLIYKNKTYAK